MVWLWSEQRGVFSHETALALHSSTAVAPTLMFNTKYQVESYYNHTEQMKVPAKTATGAWDDVVDTGQHESTPDDFHFGHPRPISTQIRPHPNPVQLDSTDSYTRHHPGWAIDDVVVQAMEASRAGPLRVRI